MTKIFVDNINECDNMVTDFMKILLKNNGKSCRCDHSYDTIKEINVSLVGETYTICGIEVQ